MTPALTPYKKSMCQWEGEMIKESYYEIGDIQNIQAILLTQGFLFFFFACKANISKYNIDCPKNNYFNLLQISGLVKREQ